MSGKQPGDFRERRFAGVIRPQQPLTGGYFKDMGATRPGANQALRLTNPRTHLTPATTAGPVTPDGARESGQPWWLVALGSGSRVRQPQSGRTLLPLGLLGPSD